MIMKSQTNQLFKFWFQPCFKRKTQIKMTNICDMKIRNLQSLSFQLFLPQLNFKKLINDLIDRFSSRVFLAIFPVDFWDVVKYLFHSFTVIQTNNFFFLMKNKGRQNNIHSFVTIKFV